MKIYYAHHLWKYNTLIEEYEIELIREAFPDATVINPNTDIELGQDEETIMRKCITSVKSCDAIVFSSLSGVIGKGVFDEISNANIVYYINNNAVVPFVGTIEIITDSSTRRIYAIVHERS